MKEAQKFGKLYFDGQESMVMADILMMEDGLKLLKI